MGRMTTRTRKPPPFYGDSQRDPQCIQTLERRATMRRMALLAIPLLVLFQQLAYAGEALTRSKAEELLDKGADASLSQWCRPGPELMRKPEFATLKDKQCGRMKVVVSGIRTLSPTEAVAEWMAVGEVDKAF